MRQFYGQFDPKVDEVAWRYFPEGYIGHAIEVGACDGIFYSNTYAFEQAGWICLAIEPNPEWVAALSRNRRYVSDYAISDKNGEAILTVYDIGQADHSGVTGIASDKRLVDGYSAKPLRVVPVEKRTLDYAIEEAGIFPKIDLVSIDTEGNELAVLHGFDIQRWKPKLILVENNYDDKDIPDYMKEQGYSRAERVGVNDFYVRH